MVEHLTFNQGVTGSRPVRPTTRLEGVPDSPKKMSIETLLSRYQLAARAAGLSPKTAEHLELSMKLFASFLGGIEDVRLVQTDDLRRFIIASQQRTRWPGMPQGHGGTRLSRNSVSNYVRGVKSFYSWLAREKIIDENPLAAVPVPKLPKLLPKIYSEEELKAVFKAADRSPRDSAILRVFLDSGVRLSELAGLEPGDVDLETGTVRVFGKGSKERSTFISLQTSSAVNVYLGLHRPAPAAADKLFLRFDGYPMTVGRVQKVLEGIGRRAGLKQRLSPHRLRHSFATHSLRNGCNLEYLKRMLGHSNVSTTEIYLHLVDKDVRDAHRSFSPIKNLLRGNVRGLTMVGGKEYRKGSPDFYEALRRQRSQ